MEKSLRFNLDPDDQDRINRLCGPTNSTLKQIEEALEIKISNRGSKFKVRGNSPNTSAAETVLKGLYQKLEKKTLVPPEEIHLYLREVMNQNSSTDASSNQGNEKITLKTPKTLVSPKGKNQQKYLEVISNKELVFGIGPAGTGKTYLAVAAAVNELITGKVEKVVVTRPAVEAGEKLGFLPGDLSQKVDPYLRPLYDALFQTLGFKETYKLIENNVIEIAPLAFMRGRTLNKSFIILDEGQNTTPEQMKMFLTRFGYGSKVIVTGDLTQIDLPKDITSGLIHALDILRELEDVGLVRFSSKDVARHSLVQKIVEAYEKFKSR
ncbi:MAG: PhoH family protein [SAR86 cluster bacterium]|nr:PhoH family protein [SAR86 cluster bacterium]|tara:strand:+ start:5388 stop:6356 length:969 start_codon:yes stop_codon:yes gene_type:complete